MLTIIMEIETRIKQTSNAALLLQCVQGNHVCQGSAQCWTRLFALDTTRYYCTLIVRWVVCGVHNYWCLIRTSLVVLFRFTVKTFSSST